MYIFLAIASGLLAIVSIILNARLASKSSQGYGAVINFFMGLLVALVLSFTDLGIYQSFSFDFPWYLLLGGLVGMVVLTLSNYVIPKIPALYSTMLNFAGQIVMGFIMDAILGNSINYQSIAGAGLMMVALLWIARIDSAKVAIAE